MGTCLITLCITDEIFNEINRKQNQEIRDKCRQFASNFTTLRCIHDEFKPIFSSLKKFLPINPSEQDLSDFTHLAKAIKAGAHFFVTRDEVVLGHSDNLYDEFYISVLRPSDLIIEIDLLFREHVYQPARLAGTLYEISRVQSKQEDMLARVFQNEVAGEKQSQFKAKLRNLLSDPFVSECNVSWSHDKQPIALIAYKRTINGELEIPLFRVSIHPLSSTLILFLISQSIQEASRERRKLIKVTDPFLDSLTKQSLADDKFHYSENCWSKLSLSVSSSKEEISQNIDQARRDFPHLKDYCQRLNTLLNQTDKSQDILNLWEIELVLWPVKIKNSGVPCFILPIKPEWAQHLFDKHFANHDMFGAKTHLALNRENVYYRSKRNSSGLVAPARILWYVSHNPRFNGAGYIRACSRLDNVIIGSAKTLYKQFRRLGIYEWENVNIIAKNNPQNDIMALKFSETELLDNPVSWKEIMCIFREYNIKAKLQCPCIIPEELFFSLYQQDQ